MSELSYEQALHWISIHKPRNYNPHDTVRVLNIEPAKSRKTLKTYDYALVPKPKKRLQHYNSYTKEQLLEIGIRYFLIKKEGSKLNEKI